MRSKTATRKEGAQTYDEAGGLRPLTHRASRWPWSRSRLSHAQRVTHSAASQSLSFGVVGQHSLHPVREKGRTRIKAPAIQPKTAPAQVRDGEAIEGVVGRDAAFSDDPIPPLWLHGIVATAPFVS